MKQKFDTYSEYIGTFILTYLGYGTLIILTLLFLGVNPTLVISVVSAPLWIIILYLSYKTTIVIKRKSNE